MDLKDTVRAKNTFHVQFDALSVLFTAVFGPILSKFCPFRCNFVHLSLFSYDFSDYFQGSFY